MNYLLFLGIVVSVYGIQFDVPSGKSRCVKDDFPPGGIIHGTYSANAPLVGYMKMGIQIYGPPNQDGTQDLIWEKDDVSTEDRSFAFTVRNDGYHSFCFIDRPRGASVGKSDLRRVTLNYKEKDTVKEDPSLSKQLLTPIESVVQRVEEKIHRLHEEFRYFREREEAHRETNESTNSRIPTLSGLTVMALMLCGAWQIYYLRNYFRKKKLI